MVIAWKIEYTYFLSKSIWKLWSIDFGRLTIKVPEFIFIPRFNCLVYFLTYSLTFFDENFFWNWQRIKIPSWGVVFAVRIFIQSWDHPISCIQQFLIPYLFFNCPSIQNYVTLVNAFYSPASLFNGIICHWNNWFLASKKVPCSVFIFFHQIFYLDHSFLFPSLDPVWIRF